MTGPERERIPVTFLLVASIVVGHVGLVMLVLGTGTTAPTTVQAPGMNLNVSTSSLALAVTVLGFAVAVWTLALLVVYARGQATGKRKGTMNLAKERPDPYAADIIKMSHAACDPLLIRQMASMKSRNRFTERILNVELAKGHTSSSGQDQEE
jgi:hypothetical protein